jgi:hypothetical protein
MLPTWDSNPEPQDINLYRARSLARYHCASRESSCNDDVVVSVRYMKTVAL